MPKSLSLSLPNVLGRKSEGRGALRGVEKTIKSSTEEELKENGEKMST